MNNIALFIDFENVKSPSLFDVGLITNNLENIGKVILKKAYANWNSLKNYKQRMIENSVDTVNVPPLTKGKKNAADIRLIVDALEAGITKDDLNTFVIITGDSDFVPLIQRLQIYKKYVIVIGNDRKTTSNLLIKTCDKFYYYSQVVGKPNCTEKEYEAFYLLIQTMEIFDTDKTSDFHKMRFIQNFMRKEYQFNIKKYNYINFKDFIENAVIQGFITLNRQESGWTIQRKASTQNLNIPKSIVLLNQRIAAKNNFKQPFDAAKIYEAIRQSNEDLNEMVSSNAVLHNLRQLYPDFQLKDYVSNKRGYKGFLQTLSKKGWIHFKNSSNGVFLIRATHKLINQYKHHNTFDNSIIYWTLKLMAYDLRKEVLLEDFNNSLYALYPDFNFHRYTNQSKDFKKLMQQVANDKYITLNEKNDNCFIRANQPLIDEFADSSKPYLFDTLFAKRILKGYQFNLNIKEVIEGKEVLMTLLERMKEDNIELETLYQRYCRKFKTHENQQAVRTSFLTLMFLNNIRNPQNYIVYFGQNDLIDINNINIVDYDYEVYHGMFETYLKYIADSNQIPTDILVNYFYQQNQILEVA
ncbi:MAG: NYN domain-containing protein [Saprospiraceae bacterium]